MILSVLICMTAYVILLWILRRDRVSFGLPFAYLSTLFLIHIPGALVHIVDVGSLEGDEFVGIGIRYAAIGAISFVVGVGIAHFHISPEPVAASSPKFTNFCIIGGLIFVIATSTFANIPSVDAVIDWSSVVWVLGTLIACALHRNPGIFIDWRYGYRCLSHSRLSKF